MISRGERKREEQVRRHPRNTVQTTDVSQSLTLHAALNIPSAKLMTH